MTYLSPIRLGYEDNPSLPILPFAIDVYETQCAERHKHPRAQLIYSSKGSMKVETEHHIWMVSSKQAIWVPSMYEHQVFFLKDVHIRNLFIDTSATLNLPHQCFALDVSPFLRELILRMVHIGSDYGMNSANGRIVNVLLDELSLMAPTPLSIPISNEIHLKKVINELCKDPSDQRSLVEFAELACVTSRTLSRLFTKELGLTFGEWRKQLRLLEAIHKLEQGISVSQISFDLGYNSPSAFIQMFRHSFGISPSKYIKDRL